MAKSYSVTSAGVSAAEDRAHRMRFYFIAMSLRVVCVASMLFVRGWWVLLCIAGAVILPYLAVMVANVASSAEGEKPERPTPLELGAGPDPESDAGSGEQEAASSPADTVIVVDAPAHRRSGETTGADDGGAAADRADGGTRETGTDDEAGAR